MEIIFKRDDDGGLDWVSLDLGFGNVHFGQLDAESIDKLEQSFRECADRLLEKNLKSPNDYFLEDLIGKYKKTNDKQSGA